MVDHLIFHMGKFEARFPLDRVYSRNHMWLAPGDAAYRAGFSAFAVRLLQDVYFLDWSVEAGAAVRDRQEIGEIESSKAVSSIYAPAAGTLVDFNRALLDDPTPINTDGYGRGWLFDFAPEAPRWMSTEEYVRYLDSIWEETQRHLKGQMHD
jgi:glycine cleavage system H protein